MISEKEKSVKNIQYLLLAIGKIVKFNTGIGIVPQFHNQCIPNKRRIPKIIYSSVQNTCFFFYTFSLQCPSNIPSFFPLSVCFQVNSI